MKFQEEKLEAEGKHWCKFHFISSSFCLFTEYLNFLQHTTLHTVLHKSTANFFAYISSLS
jgi:hypothetical protein